MKLERLATLSLFKGLPGAALEQVARSMTLAEARNNGDAVFDIGDTVDRVFLAAPDSRSHGAPVFIRLEMPIAQDSAPFRFERIVDGDIFGEMEWLLSGLAPSYAQRPATGRRRETRAQLTTAAEIWSLDLATLAVLVEDQAVLRQRLTRLGTTRLRRALTAEAGRRHLDGDALLATYLLDMAEDHQRIQGNYASFTHKISQEEMAVDLGISRRTLSDRLRVWSESGLVRTTPMEVLDIRRMRQLEQVGRLASRMHIVQATAEIDALIQRGDLNGAHAMAMDMIRHFPSSPDLVHRAALADARAGRWKDANDLLDAASLGTDDPDALLRRVRFGQLRPGAPVAARVPEADIIMDMAEAMIPDGDDDTDAMDPMDERPAKNLVGELLALRARLAKDRALVSGASADAEAAAAAYEVAGMAGAGIYGTTNAAVLFALAGNHARATTLAGQIAARAPGTDYWSQSSQVEAHLLLGDRKKAIASVEAAMQADHSDAMVASTRRQLRQMAGAFPVPVAPILDKLLVRKPFVFTGPLIRNQFTVDPAEVEAVTLQLIDELLDEDSYGCAFGPLAQGADILFAERALARGLEFNAVLPLDIESFIEASVDPHWVSRFHNVIASSDSVTIAQTGTPALRNFDIAIQHGFRCAGAMALERAADLETTAVLLAINAAGPGGRIAGTDAAVADWCAQGGELRHRQLPYAKTSAAGRSQEVHTYRFAVFYFPDGEASEAPVSAFAKASFDGPVLARTIKDGRDSAVALLDDLDAAGTLAFRLAALPGGGRVVCSYGPALKKSGSADGELIAGLAGAADFPGFPRDAVLAALPFAREVQFRRGGGLAVTSLAHRADRIQGVGRQRIVPISGVYELKQRA